MGLPTLYSFRRCPYAMRARLAIAYAEQAVHKIEVELRNKPAEMLALSPKGTVPVLQLSDGTVLEESLDIMLWALGRHDPQQLLPSGQSLADTLALIQHNDGEFKHWLDHYKYAIRFPEQPPAYYRTQGEHFLRLLEQRLQQSAYLFGEQVTLGDIAIMPFVRQFAHVDKAWFDKAPYPALQRWLSEWLAADVFAQIMAKPPKTASPA